MVFIVGMADPHKSMAKIENIIAFFLFFNKLTSCKVFSASKTLPNKKILAKRVRLGFRNRKKLSIRIRAVKLFGIL